MVFNPDPSHLSFEFYRKSSHNQVSRSQNQLNSTQGSIPSSCLFPEYTNHKLITCKKGKEPKGDLSYRVPLMITIFQKHTREKNLPLMSLP